MIDWSTVAIPVAKGIDVNTRARLVDNGHLIEAINTRFTRGGAEKRRGHEARRIRSTTALPENVNLPVMSAPSSWVNYATSDRGIPSEWLFGWGAVVDAVPVRALSETFELSPHPDAAVIFGTATRDSEVLFWNGHQLLSRTPGQPAGAPLSTVGPAIMPMLRAAPIAKAPRAQINPDGADTGVIRVVAWIDGSDVHYSVVDSSTGAVILADAALGHVDADSFRCVSVGQFVHIVVFDNDADTLTMHTVHEASPTQRSSKSLGACATYFDVAKVDQSLWGIAQNHADGNILVTWWTAEGSGADRDALTYTPSNAPVQVALGAHPSNGHYALAYSSGVGVYARTFDEAGTPRATEVEIQSIADTIDGGSPGTPGLLTIAPKYLTHSSEAVYNIHWMTDTGAAGKHTRIARIHGASANPEYKCTRYNVQPASQAFRCGDRTFLWVSNPNSLRDLQASLILLDEGLLPTGHVEYASFNPTDYTVTANWCGSVPVKDLLVYHFAFGYRVRVPAEGDSTSQTTLTQGTLGVTPTPVYAEPSINWVEMDFLPNLVWAQAGRCTYFAGAQLWVYDGQELTEAGFHLAPELDVAPAQSNTVNGALTAAGVYTWRIDLCYRNAQNEEIRSHSFFTPEVTLGVGNDTVTLVIQTMPTRRTNAYLLVFRNPSTETNWYLSNSRDPSSAVFLRNDPALRKVTFIDDALQTPSDDQLLTRELHPGNAGVNYVQPIAAPACEIVAVGQNRLWVAGGEIPPSQAHPSRLYEVGDCPSFHPILAVQIDRASEPVTAIGFIGDLAVFFRRHSAYILDNVDGPDNMQQGSWGAPRLALADVGAVSQASLGRITQGLVFQSPAGIRLMPPSASIIPIGEKVDSVAKALEINSVVVVGQDQEIRWYSRSGTVLVYNYQHDAWSTWTLASAGAVRNPSTGLAVASGLDGYELVETDGVWLDNGSPFTHRIRFAWLRSGSLVDYQRVRRFAVVGEANSEHHVHIDAYYDEREFAGETFDWDYPADDADPSWNPDTFGAASFGDGVFGDTGAQVFLRDAVWRCKRRLGRQKCSVISLAIDDRGTEGAGFVVTALALELGQKRGLDRMPWRGSDSTGNGR